MFVDLELGYNFNDNLRFLVGGSNVFDEFVDQIRPTDTCGSSGLTCANRWMPYARRGELRGRFLVRAGRL